MKSKPTTPLCEVRQLDSDHFKVTQPLKYQPVPLLTSLLDKYAFRHACILEGHKGVGKTLAIHAFAKKANVPVVTVDCSEDLRRSHLLGFYTMQGDQTPFILGPIPTAIDLANQTGACILLFEEINALAPQCQKIVNPLTDFRGKIEVPEIGTSYSIAGKLWVVGTMNFSNYGGVFELNEDLKSRFRVIPVDAPEESDTLNILQMLFPSRPADYLKLFVRLMHDTQKSVEISYVLSIRDIVQLLEDIELFEDEDAPFFVLLGKFEAEERKFVKQRVSSIFGVTLP